MRHRKTEALLVVAISIAATLFMLSGGDITGFAAYDGDEIIVSGISFDAKIGSIMYYYIFSDNEWFESEDIVTWEKIPEMGDTVWTGLYYLKSYDAEIYHKGEEIKYIGEFARDFND